MQMRKSQSVSDIILRIPLLYNNGSSAVGLSLASLSTKIIKPDGTALTGYNEATFTEPNGDGVYVMKFPTTAVTKAFTIVDDLNPYTVTLDSTAANVDPMAVDLFVVSKMPWELATPGDILVNPANKLDTDAAGVIKAYNHAGAPLPTEQQLGNLQSALDAKDLLPVDGWSPNGFSASYSGYIGAPCTIRIISETFRDGTKTSKLLATITGAGLTIDPGWTGNEWAEGCYVSFDRNGDSFGPGTLAISFLDTRVIYRTCTINLPGIAINAAEPSWGLYLGHDGQIYRYSNYQLSGLEIRGPWLEKRDAEYAREASIASLQNSVRRAIWQSVPALGVVDVTDIAWSGSPFAPGTSVEIWGDTLSGDAITGDRGRAGYFDETGWHKDQNLGWAGGIFLKFVGGAPSDGILLILYDKAYGAGYENVAVSVKAGDSYGVGLVLRDGTVLDQAWATWTPVRGAISADEIGTRVQDLPVKIWENTGRSEMPHLLRAGLFAGGERIEDVKYYREDGSLNTTVWTNPVSFVGQDIRVPQGGGRIQLVDHASPLGDFDGVTFTPVGPNWFDAVKFPSLILTAAECDGGYLEVSVQMRGAGVRKVYVVMPACPVDPSAPLWIAADGSLLAEWNYSWAAWTVSFSQYFIQKHLSGKIGADLAASHGAGSWEGVTLPDIEGSPVLAKESTSQSIKTDTSAIRNPGVPCTGLTAQAKSEVNAEVVDALETDTYAELMGTPPPPWTIRKMVQWLFQYFKHPRKMTDVEEKLYQSDGATVAGTRSVSETATQVNLGKME
jgi:hypothetical protein